LGGGDDYRRFFALAKDLPDDWRDELRSLGYERANRLLCSYKHVVELVAQQLIERGRLTAAEFKHLTGADRCPP
jgi:ATP-dependent Zn protease